MPKVSRESATQGGDYGPVVDHSEEFERYAVNFLAFREDVDHGPLLRGLPDDRCQCPHWGYVFKGTLVFRYADRDETYEAGDAFYAPPGHVPVHTAPGTEYLQFSPADELRRTSEVIMKNFQSPPAQG
ncbi:cupin domain-containing protein [Streptomyces sp. 7R007]